MTIRIYLAGPDVFQPDFGAGLFARKKSLCDAYGFIGVAPVDNAMDLSALAPFDQGMTIYRANVDIMRACDAVIANMTPFRGVSMDGGTAFEMGFMRALGKPVLAYTNVTEDYTARCSHYYADQHAVIDRYSVGTSIERFEMADNLMMAGAVRDSGFDVVVTTTRAGEELLDVAGFEACLKQLAASRGS